MAGVRLATSLLIIGVLRSAVPGAGQAQLLGDLELTRVDFVGNEVFPDDSLRFAIANQQTECRTFVFQVTLFCPLGFGFAIDRRFYYPRQLPVDSVRLKAFYHEHGYREASIGTTVVVDEADNGGGVALAFTIDEGRPVLVDTVAYVGLENVDRGAILDRLPLGAGAPLSTLLLDATRDTILSRLRNSGYAHADVLRGSFIPIDRPYTAIVDFNVSTGLPVRFGPIVLQREAGTEVLSEDALMRMLPFEEGDPYRAALVLEARRNLFGLEIVRNASIRQHLDFEPDTVVPLTVQVVEGDVHRVRGGVGWSTADCLNAEASWASRNFLGSARRLQFRGRVSNVLAPDFQETACPESGVGDFGKVNWLASAELSFPWFLSQRNALTLSLFAERQSLPDVFVRNSVGLSATLTRSLGPGNLLAVVYRPQFSSLEAAGLFFCTSFLVCDPDDIGDLEKSNWLSPLGATLTRTRTDDLLNPSDGYQLLLDLEHASTLTGSEFAHNRIIVEGSWYDQLARRTVWAAHLRLGWVAGGDFGGLSRGGKDVIHPQKRFYAGGANSVRGYAQNRLGPRVLTAEVEELVGYREDSNREFFQACLPEEVRDQICDPSELSDRFFLPQAQGGSRLFEASLEYRFAAGGEMQGVLFTDFGQVWGENESIRLDQVRVSPGAGIRYFSPIGPLRIDVGYRFGGAEQLQVVTSLLREYNPATDTVEDWLPVQGIGGVSTMIPWIKESDLSVMDPRIPFEGSTSFFRHIQLHFSIGQAF